MLHYCKKDVMEVGTDEAGLGPLFGPVFAAAVYWPEDLTHPLIKDSKQLNRREKLIAYDFVREEAIAFGISKINANIIDKINNKQAGIKAMHQAIDQTDIIPDHIVVDGNYFRFYLDKNKEQVSHTCVIGGDAKYYSIAAASILAKVSHDMEIQRLCDTYSELELYDLRNNMGYGTAKHCEAIQKYGPTQFHRKTFKKVREYTNHMNLIQNNT